MSDTTIVPPTEIVHNEPLQLVQIEHEIGGRYLHCARCIKSRQRSRLSVSMLPRADGTLLQVWCVRHDCEVFAALLPVTLPDSLRRCPCCDEEIDFGHEDA